MTASNRHHWRGWHVVHKSAALDGKTVQLHQTLADLRIRRGINLTPLRITKKIVQDIEAALSLVVGSVMAYVTSLLVDGVVNGPIALWLLRLIVSIVAAIVMRLAIGSVLRMHLWGGMVVITCSPSFAVLRPVTTTNLTTMLVRGAKY